MAIADERIKSDSRLRVEAITFHFFNATGEVRQRIYDRLAGSRQFAEFVPACQAGSWLSHALLQQQFQFAHPLPAAHTPLNVDDVLYLIELEEQFREKRQISLRLVELAEQAQSKSKNEIARDLSALVEVRPKMSLSLDGSALYAARKNRPRGIVTGVRRLDEVTGGIGYGVVTTIAGWVGSYKSLFKTNLNYNALTLGYGVLDGSLEIPKDDLYFQYLARHSFHPKFLGIGQPVDWRGVSKALLTPEQESFLWGVVEPDFKALPGKLIVAEQMDIPGWDYLTLRAWLDALGDIDIMSVDFVQMLMLDGSQAKGIREPRDYGNFVINELRKLAVGSENLDKPGDISERRIVLLLSQSNRDGFAEATENKGQYTLRALSDLNMLERASSYVIFVYVDDELRASGQAKIQLAKHRFGEVINEPLAVPVDARYLMIGDTIEGYRAETQSPAQVVDLFAGIGGGDGGLSF